MARRGPFTTYKPEYCGLARNFCRLGATNAELARMFESPKARSARWAVCPKTAISLPTQRSETEDRRTEELMRGLKRRVV
jgi:hypothetical protein